jgi:aryl-alcohol dehydrogenase-like predicted oxidoreductase
MDIANLGKTGLKVSRLGAGLVEIGDLDVARAGRLLNEAVDGGVTFLDTAECYGRSEELIGRTVAHRRHEYVLATKAGHAVDGDTRAVGVASDGSHSWTVQTVTDSIDRSLRRLKTDHVDLLQVHADDTPWPLDDEIISAFLDAKQAGKTRFLGYSQEGRHAELALRSGLFDTLQTSFSLVDQRPRHGLLELAKAEGVGVIAKRPIANAVWGRIPVDEEAASEREQALQKVAQLLGAQGPIPNAPDDSIALALGFVLAQPEVDTAIVGTGNPDHMRQNIKIVEDQLPLSAGVVAELQRRYNLLDWTWEGVEEGW